MFVSKIFCKEYKLFIKFILFQEYYFTLCLGTLKFIHWAIKIVALIFKYFNTYLFVDIAFIEKDLNVTKYLLDTNVSSKLSLSFTKLSYSLM